MVPERRRAIRMPSMRPEVTIERETPFLLGGASSPTRGSISCGVTVVAPTMKERAEKTGREVVMQRPILVRWCQRTI